MIEETSIVISKLLELFESILPGGAWREYTLDFKKQIEFQSPIPTVIIYPNPLQPVALPYVPPYPQEPIYPNPIYPWFTGDRIICEQQTNIGDNSGQSVILGCGTVPFTYTTNPGIFNIDVKTVNKSSISGDSWRL